MFTVHTHGGNNFKDKWEVVFATNDRNEAIKYYNALKIKLRKGGLELRMENRVILTDWAKRIK